VPIIEPEVDIHSPDKAESENILKAEIVAQLQKLDKNDRIMLKISIPTTADFYADVMRDPHMVRVVALSGGYGREEADELLAQNHGLIASFLPRPVRRTESAAKRRRVQRHVGLFDQEHLRGFDHVKTVRSLPSFRNGGRSGDHRHPYNRVPRRSATVVISARRRFSEQEAFPYIPIPAY
jgi:hypothetical protein